MRVKLLQRNAMQILEILASTPYPGNIETLNFYFILIQTPIQ